jgi:hypothetical protein
MDHPTSDDWCDEQNATKCELCTRHIPSVTTGRCRGLCKGSSERYKRDSTGQRISTSARCKRSVTASRMGYCVQHQDQNPLESISRSTDIQQLISSFNKLGGPMVTQWKCHEVRLPFVPGHGYDYNVLVDWGDGSEFTRDTLTHRYSDHTVVHTVRIYGHVPA